jgi:hypothetical protein
MDEEEEEAAAREYSKVALCAGRHDGNWSIKENKSQNFLLSKTGNDVGNIFLRIALSHYSNNVQIQGHYLSILVH